MTLLDRDAATAFAAEHNQPVFPVRHKQPLAEFSWPQKASSDAATIAAMPWEESTGWAIALRGWTVVDIDDADAASHLVHRLPASLSVATPSGGLHIYFVGSAACGNQVRIADGVDIRTDGGYVVGAGSRAAKRGVWQVSDDLPVAPLPPELFALLEAMPQTPGRTRANTAMVGPYGQGERNSGMASEAGRLMARNPAWSQEELRAEMLALNQRLCDPPLPDHELLRTADSIWRIERRRSGAQLSEARRLAALVSDQLAQTSEPLALVAEFARARQVSPMALLGAVLAALSACVPPEAVLRTGPADSPLTLFTLIAGPSGAGKSSVLAAALELIGPLPHDVEIASPASGEALIDSFCGWAETDDGERAWQQTRTGVLVVLDELAQFNAAAGRGDSTLAPLMRSMWSGAQLRADVARRGGGPGRPAIRRFSAGAIAAGTLDSVHHLTGGAQAGTPQRWLMLPALDSGALSAHDAVAARRATRHALSLPSWPNSGASGVGQHMAKQAVDVDVGVELEIAENRRKAVAGDDGAPEGHADLRRLRTAAMLAWLHSRPGVVTPEDWEMAALVEQSMAGVRAMADEAALAAADDSARARGRADSIRARSRTSHRMGDLERLLGRCVESWRKAEPDMPGELPPKAACKGRKLQEWNALSDGAGLADMLVAVAEHADVEGMLVVADGVRVWAEQA